METITITKLDAARRQLRTAIDLWFNEGDAVSLHTLAHSSHEIIHRLYRRAGFEELLWNTTIIEDEYHRDFIPLMKNPSRFFKHLNDEDPDAMEFNTGINDAYLIMSVIALRKMDVTPNEIESCFMFWHRIHFPHWFPEDIFKDRIPVEGMNQIRHMDKRDFFKHYIDYRRRTDAAG